MNKTWKWILGILLVLVIVGAFFTTGYAWQARAHPMSFRAWDGPMGRGNNGWEHPHMWDRDNGWQHPMMPMRGAPPFFGGFFVFSGLAKLVLFGGLLYGAYWLGRRNARIALDPHPAAPASGTSAPESDSSSG